MDHSSLFSARTPRRMSEALLSPPWKEAINTHCTYLLEYGALEVVDQPPHNGVEVEGRWRFSVKYYEDGSVASYKAILAAVVEGSIIEYTPEVPFRLLVSLATQYRWKLHHFDIPRLGGHEKIMQQDCYYMLMPEGVLENEATSRCCKINMCIHGFDEIRSIWSERFDRLMGDLGFVRGWVDGIFYTHSSVQGLKTIVMMHFDEIVITGDDSKFINSTRVVLTRAYNLTHLGDVRFFGGLVQLTRRGEDVFLSQSNFILNMLREEPLLQQIQPCPTPIEGNIVLDVQTGEQIQNPEDYETMVDLLSNMSFTRPDISFALDVLEQSRLSPRQPHLRALHRVFGYLKHTWDKGLLYTRQEGSSNSLCCFTTTTFSLQRLYTANASCTFHGLNLISWSSSQYYWEYVNRFWPLDEAIFDVVMVRDLMRDLEFDQVGHTPIYCHEGTQHDIDNHYYLFRDGGAIRHIWLREVALWSGPSTDLISNVLTETYDAAALDGGLQALGMTDGNMMLQH